MAIQTRITQRFDVLSNWIQNDIVLLQGELAVVDCGNQTRFKVGDGTKRFTQLPFVDQSQLCTRWIAADAVSQGLHASSVPYGFAAGAYLCANANFSQALGFDSHAISTDTYAFVWNGDDTRAIEDYYTSHGKGTFSVNPLSGLSGVFIGEQNLAEVLDENSGSTITIDDRISGICKETDLSIVKISAEDYAGLVAGDALLSDVLYVVEGSYEDVYGQQVKNMAPGTDLSDAVNLEQLTEVSSRAYDTYTQTEVDQKIASAQYFKKYVVQTLPPVAEADERGIYLVPSTDSELSNVYDEYVTVGEGAQKAWEKIGAKNIDLSGYKTKQTAKTSPTASGATTTFIDTISQDENGVITATKKNVQTASTTHYGIVQLNNTLTSTSTTQAATANAVKLTNDKFADYSLTSHVHDQYLTAVPSDYKTYAQTKQSLSADGYATQEQLNEKSAISVDNVKADVNMVHISLDDYNDKLVDGEILSNELYVISSDYVETYGQQIKNVADPTDLSDAATKGYVDSNFQPAGSYLTAHQPISATYVNQHIKLSANNVLVGNIDCSDFIKDGMLSTVELCSDQLIFVFNAESGKTAISVALSNFIDETNYYTKAELTSDGGVLKNYSLTSHVHSDYVLTSRTVAGQALTADVTAATISSAIGLDQYLTAVPSDYKTYAQTKQSLSADGYATQEQLNEKSAVSVDNIHADANLLHISQEDYNQLVADDAALSNTMYVVSADYVETYGQQIKNVADPTDLSDAATKGYVDSNFQPAGSYLTAVPDAYKTYAATLSSLSSDYSLTSHTHSNYVLTSRTVAGQALTADVTAATISSAIGLSNYYGKTETSSAAQISAADELLSSELSAKSSISVDTDFAPRFKFEHISLEDYISKSISGIVDGNTLYDISSENMTVFDQKIVDLAPGEDPTDAPNMSQLTEVSARACDTYTQLEVDSKIANIEDKIRYSLSTASTSTSGTTQTVELADRANNSAAQESGMTTVALAFPAATSGKARDFILAITCGSTPPNVVFPSGVTIVVDDYTDLTAEEGLNLYSFTEISANTFVVSRLLVTAYSAQ